MKVRKVKLHSDEEGVQEIRLKKVDLSILEVKLSHDFKTVNNLIHNVLVSNQKGRSI